MTSADLEHDALKELVCLCCGTCGAVTAKIERDVHQAFCPACGLVFGASDPRVAVSIAWVVRFDPRTCALGFEAASVWADIDGAWNPRALYALCARLDAEWGLRVDLAPWEEQQARAQHGREHAAEEHRAR